MKSTAKTSIKYTILLAFGALSGVLLHLTVIYIEATFMKKTIQVNFTSSFFDTAFSFPFLPVLLIEAISTALIFFLWMRMRNALKKSFQLDLKQKTFEEKVSSLQSLMGVFATHIGEQNNIILNKLNFRKSKGQQVSSAVEEASLKIGKILAALSEVSYAAPYTAEAKENMPDLVEVLKQRIELIAHSEDKPVAGS